jgi:hypothetical protein
MPVIGNHKVKLNLGIPETYANSQQIRMVLLSEVHTQYPWSFVPNVQKALWDKEILTQEVEDDSTTWRIPILPCLSGFAYVGFKVNTFQHDNVEITSARTAQGAKNKHLFGEDDVIQIHKYPSGYIPLNFPIVSRLCHLNEDEIHLILTFNTPVAGNVELLAQKFDDLPEDDFRTKYYYTFNDQNGMLLKTEQYISFMKCDRISAINFYPSAVRLYRLNLDQNAL